MTFELNRVETIFEVEDRIFTLLEAPVSDVRTKLIIYKTLTTILNPFIRTVLDDHLCEIKLKVRSLARNAPKKDYTENQYILLAKLRSFSTFEELVMTYDAWRNLELATDKSLYFMDILIDVMESPIRVDQNRLNEEHLKTINKEWWQSKKQMLDGILRHIQANIF